MPKILYASGKEVYIEPEELGKMILKFQNSGVRMTKTKSGNILFLNSSTMDYIDVSDMKKNVVIPVVVVDPTEFANECPTPVVEEKKPDYVDPVATFNNEPKVESAAEKEARVLQEIIKKSDCTHQGTSVMYKQQTVKGEKYFQKCTFCGWRSRFIKASSLTADELSKAEIYRGE